MNLSLLGGSVLLLLCNPVLLVHSYDFWLCFGAAWIYLLGAGLIYEVILCGLWRNVPTAVILLSQTSSDSRLPLRMAIHASVLSYYCWNVCRMFAMGSMDFLGSSSHLVLKRLSARSTIPLISMLFLCKSLLNGCVCGFAISLAGLFAICSGKHLVRGCAAVSAILAFGMAVQYMTYPASSLCAAIELSTPLLGKLAQAPMKRPTAAVEYLSIVELAGHEAAIQQWLSTEPEMGNKRLCTKMLAEKKLHVTPATARNYLLRLKREPATPRRKKRRSIRGSGAAADGTSESDDAVDYLSIVELAEHEAAIHEWLESEPDMGKRRLCAKMLSEKKLHVKPRTAQNYLTRLKRPAETPRRRDRRAMRGSSGAVGDVAGLRTLKRGQLERYKPAVLEAFERNASTTKAEVRTILADDGVAASKADLQHLWYSMKNEHWDSKAKVYFPMSRLRSKRTGVVPCTIGHKDIHNVELLLRQHLVREPSMSVRDLQSALRARGYEIAEDPFVRVRLCLWL